MTKSTRKSELSRALRIVPQAIAFEHGTATFLYWTTNMNARMGRPVIVN
jgi:hypothetical protein